MNKKTFIKASTFKFKLEVIDDNKISQFIEKFNEAIRDGNPSCSIEYCLMKWKKQFN